MHNDCDFTTLLKLSILYLKYYFSDPESGGVRNSKSFTATLGLVVHAAGIKLNKVKVNDKKKNHENSIFELFFRFLNCGANNSGRHCIGSSSQYFTRNS